MASPKNPLGRAAKPPLQVFPISVWGPSMQNAKLPPSTPEDKRRGCFRTEGDKDSLLTNLELAAGAVSSILWDSDLKREDAMSVEEALALSLQGAATLCPGAFFCSIHRFFKLSINFILFIQMATYMKSLARRASFSKGSARAVKTHKAKVASLTSENVDLRARKKRLDEDTIKYESDLKHTTTAKARAIDKDEVS